MLTTDIRCGSGAALPGLRPPASASTGRRPTRLLLLVGLLAGVNASDASAAALGSVATSAGLLATLLAVFAMKGWPSVVSTSAVSTAGGALLVAAAVAFLLPGRSVGCLRALKGRPWSWLTQARVASWALRASGRSGRGVDDAALRGELTSLFLRVHEAWGRGTLLALNDCIAPELLTELVHERSELERGAAVEPTEFGTIVTEVVGLESLAGCQIASVAFSGTLREGPQGAFVPFREFWLLTRPEAGGAGWRLARHQALF